MITVATPQRLLPRAVLLLTLAAPALATGASNGPADQLVESDMAFARLLAERYAYTDLAEVIIADLEERGLSGTDAEGLGLLRCDVYAAGARGERRVERREEVFDKAIGAYRRYLEEHPYSAYIPDAQRGYVELVTAYGRMMEERLEEVHGEEAQALQDKIKEVVGGGMDLLRDLIDSTINARTVEEKNERYRLMLNQGNMYFLLAKLTDDPYKFGKAEQALEDVALEAGARTGAELQAFMILAKVKLAQGLAEDAAAFGEYVLDVAVPATDEGREESGWNESSFEELVPRWTIAEVGTPIALEALQASGDDEQAAFWGLHFYNTWKHRGFDLTPAGHLGLLAAANALASADGFVGGQLTGGDLQWFATEEEMANAGFRGARNARSALDLALSIAQTVNEENQGSSLQVRAQQVISEVVSRPGVTVSPDVLFEAAKGEFNARNYGRAIDAFKDILRRLETRDEAMQQEFAPKVLYHIGKSLSYLDRPLEAAMAYREAATTWSGDPEYQEKVANGYYRSIAAAKRGAAAAPQLESLYLEAEKILASANTGDGGSILYRQAERAYGEGDYAGARGTFLQVPEGAELYERALVRAALCLYKVKNYANAKAEFQRYLEVTVNDPRLKPVDASKRETRQQAMAMATYYLGVMATNDMDFEGVVQWLTDYHTNFAGQDDYGPRALWMLTKAHIARKDLTTAKAVVADSRDTYGDSEFVGRAAYEVYAALEAEREQALKDEDDERSHALAVEMVEYIHLRNATAGKPNYSNLRAEAGLWIALEKWTEAEGVLRDTVRAYGEDHESVLAHVLPDLGFVLLEQKRVPEAFEVLDPLVHPADGSRPSAYTTESWVRAVAGWVEGDEQNVLTVPGTGGAELLEEAASLVLKLTDQEGAREKYTCPWYRLKFATAYTYYQWGLEDSSKLTVARESIENLQTLLSDNRLGHVAETCGGKVLQARFLWLEGKLR